MYILRCMGWKFCARFQRAPLKFSHTIMNWYTAKYEFTDFYFCVWFTIYLNRRHRSGRTSGVIFPFNLSYFGFSDLSPTVHWLIGMWMWQFRQWLSKCQPCSYAPFDIGNPNMVITVYADVLRHGYSCFHPLSIHDDVIKWNHFSRCWPFVRGIHRSPVNSPHKRQWRGALIFFIWVNSRDAGDLRRHCDHYDVTGM